MKVFSLPPGESWICDRFVAEWNAYSGIATTNPYDADIIWLLADWCWNQVPVELLKSKKVIATVHHIVPDKFGPEEAKDFAMRDLVVDAYHAPCNKTAAQIRELTTKPIFTQPFWVNQNIWAPIPFGYRSLFGLEDNQIVVGSFQRDTEGHDLRSPKLEKGPDLFCDAVIALADDYAGERDVVALLGGWRRQYVIGRLEEAGVPYVYRELPDADTIRHMYAACSLYIVGARYEGGPQAIVEAAAMRRPIISTDVGVASEILHPGAIWSNASDVPSIYRSLTQEHVDHAYSKVCKLFMPNGFTPFVDFMETL